MSRRHLTLLTLAVLAAPGCGASMPNTPPMALSAIGQGAPPSLPMILELREGDRIPLDLKVDGDFFMLDSQSTPPTLVVRRKVYVVMTEDEPPRLSADGKTLGNIRGTLSVGLGVTKQGGPRASVHVRTEARE